jgi:hypothetical protein
MLLVLGLSMQVLHTTNTLVAEQHSGSKSDTTDHQKILSTHTRVKEVMAAESTVRIHARSGTTKKTIIGLSTAI